MSKLLNVRQLAAVLQCHEKSIYRWMREGILPYPVKKVGTRLWDYDEVIQRLRDKPQGQSSVAMSSSR